MFEYFYGTVKEIDVNSIVLETGGIGYAFTVSRFCLNNVKLGDNIKLYAYLSVPQDGLISLYGFYSKEEKAMFMRLTTINGIGPKGAVGILSGLALNDLCLAIASGDSKALTSIKGIGKKIAERIVLELRDKMGEEFALGSDSGINSALGDVGEDAILALMALGYSKQEATSAIKKIDTNGKTVEDIIKAAFKRG